MTFRPTFAARLPTVLLCLSLAGCATTQAAPSPADPWERVNRSTYAFNDGLDRAVLKPVAKGYRRYVPQPVRTAHTDTSGLLLSIWESLGPINVKTSS